MSLPNLLVLIFLNLHKMMSLVGYQNVRGFFLLDGTPEESKVSMASITHTNSSSDREFGSK